MRLTHADGTVACSPKVRYTTLLSSSRASRTIGGAGSQGGQWKVMALVMVWLRTTLVVTTSLLTIASSGDNADPSNTHYGMVDYLNDLANDVRRFSQDCVDVGSQHWVERMANRRGRWWLFAGRCRKERTVIRQTDVMPNTFLILQFVTVKSNSTRVISRNAW